MICARGKVKPRILKLTLRCGGRKSLWVPLVLRWRRRRTAPRDAVADRKSSPATQASLTHNYFYFVTHANGSSRRQPAVRVFPTRTIYRERVTPDRGRTNSTTVYRNSQNPRNYHPFSRLQFAAVPKDRERIVFDRNRISVVSIDRGGEPSRAHRRSCINYVSPRALPGLIIERIESLLRFRSLQPSNDLIRHSPRTSPVKQLPPALRVATSREELTRLFKTQLRTREYQPLVLPMRAPMPEPIAPARSSQKKSTRIQFEAPAELVWRRTLQPVTKFETGGRADVLAAGQREPARAVVEETAAQTASSTTGRAAPQQITKLDPALVDRLTDDVIRRVEQRARIERQRRGL